MGVLRLGRSAFPPGRFAVMAIVNRTPDSFYDQGATFGFEQAWRRVQQVVAEGADIVDVGGVKAGAGEHVSEDEEIDRVAGLVSAIREAYPQVVISVDTYRARTADALCAAGADLVNDTWAGADPEVAAVAAQHGAGLVCSHTGGMRPRTLPHRVAYDDVVADVLAHTTALAERAVQLGVPREGILIDPTHDFGKNTFHSLELTRRLDELVATGWPVLVSLSRKDFVGETLDLPVDERLTGTLTATAVSAWHGARVFRAHDVAATRQVLDMVASIRGDRPPAAPLRGLT
ncbi:Dihydropteroate synthase [Jiangella alba]|uniref:Dihydropteroate synthase n=2 Tax=Jiangella alba TaxID=561176 RepID=A0A1H5PVR9_9ACTN|nr:dihydropteroate synthase [Jiangella alba]SEF17744.1 Dihydropteroate synthase [Jiangella alba]